MPYVIGLTGNIACGKSTVAAMLAELGAEVIDADRVAHEVMAPPGPVFQAIVREYGPEVVAPDGSLDRKQLGAIVFADPAKLRRLDEMVHPQTGAAIRRRIQESPARVVVVEAIKLIESGTYRVCDAVWLVTCDPQKQVERLVAQRHLSPEDASLRVQAQSPAQEKLPFATLVLDANGTLDETRRQVLAAWSDVVREAGRGPR